MKRLSSALALTLGLLLVSSGIPLVYSGTMGHGPGGHPEETTESPPAAHGGMMGSGMMGMMGRGGMGMMGSSMMPERMQEMHRGEMRGRPRMMGAHRPRQLMRMLQTELGLSADQAKQIRPIVVEAIKTHIKDRASLQVARIDLDELLEADPVDMAKVESQLKTMEGLRTDLRLSMIKAYEQAKAFLTPEQRQKLASLHERMHGMMGMERMGQGMMGQGGMRGMGMMQPGMEAEMSLGRGPMMQMRGMMQQMGGMTRQMAERLESGQLTPEQMKQMGEVMAQMGSMMGNMQSMMGGMGPGANRQQMMARMSGMMQHMSDMQKHMSEMMGTPQSHHESQQQ